MGLCSPENDISNKSGLAKLYQLQSLLFACERSISNSPENEANERGLCSALKLLGFLEAEASADLETAVLVEPLKRQCYKHLESATATQSSDEAILQRAGCTPGFKFQETENPNLTFEKLSKLQPYRALIHPGEEAPRSARSLVRNVPRHGTIESLRHATKILSTEEHAKGGFTKSPPDPCFAKRLGSSEVQQEDSQCDLQGLLRGKPWGMPEPHGHRVPDERPPIPDNEKQAGASTFTKRQNPYQQLDWSGHSKRQRGTPRQEARDSCDADRDLMVTGAVSLRHSGSNDRGGTKDRDDDIEEEEHARAFSFVTATQKLSADAQRGGMAYLQKSRLGYSARNNSFIGSAFPDGAPASAVAQPGKPVSSLRRGARTGFVPPARLTKEGAQQQGMGTIIRGAGTAAKKSNTDLDDSTLKCLEMLVGPDGELPECLRNLEPRLLEHVSNEIMTRTTNTTWADIAGLEHAKKCVDEMVIWPLKRPDLFRGTRKPGTGLLLYGPPGTGKTLIGRAIAGESKATFFSISASSLTSKWIGEGEKLVRALFGVARCRQPAVIFVDEIDSLLSQRKSDGEHESSRRLKTQFLIEMEGCGSGDDRILLIGATNRPQELDEAARRRMSKRLYIPLPEEAARAHIIRSLLQKDALLSLSDEEISVVAAQSEGFSGSDMTNLVKDAAMAPMREVMRSGADIDQLKQGDIRPLSLEDFKSALKRMRPSVAPTELKIYEEWSRQFGSGDLNSGVV